MQKVPGENMQPGKMSNQPVLSPYERKKFTLSKKKSAKMSFQEGSNAIKQNPVHLGPFLIYFLIMPVMIESETIES